MDALETCYVSVAKSFQTVGQVVFTPYSSFRVTLQTLRFITMNLLSYLRLTVVYYHNLIHTITESSHDKETFLRSYQQRKVNNKLRVRSQKLQVAVNIEEKFDPPSSLQGLISSVWFRAGYYYDKYVVNLPMALLNGSTSSYIYDPNPEISLPSGSGTKSAPTSTTEEKNSLKIDFVPKPYVITKTLESRGHNTISATQKCPVLSGLFEENCESNNKAEAPKLEPHEQEEVPKPDDLTAPANTGKSIFYKIKIRRKHSKTSEEFKDNPTYQRYDLVEQAIRNVIPQPDYQPDGTIGPNLIRFAWHCCAHYDKVSGTGGSSGGTMRFAQEFNDLGNTGLNTSKSYLDQVHEEYPWISFADLYTLGGVVAIQAIGGPKVEWKPGRTDCPGTVKVPPMGRLPNATKDYNHIKEVFYGRLGFNAQETVALIGGGHGIGGCHARYSGFNGIWTKAPFSWDNDFFKVLLEENWSLGIVPETGIEQYYNDDKSLMMLNTDIELLRCPEFKKWVTIYANDSKYFDEQFALAFAKLLELGVIRDADGIQRVKI